MIIFEGIEAPATLGLKASRSANYQRKKQGFYARFFLTKREVLHQQSRRAIGIN
ncbi:hypothetical protein [Escherichia coli]|uniref:hypothetical protein n=1 Tax=Escherichia coli TaxID=562 RepID=UPI003D9A84D6